MYICAEVHCNMYYLLHYCDFSVVINLAETLSEEQFDSLVSAFQSDTEETGELSEHGSRRLQMDTFKVLLEKILSIPEDDQRIGVLCKKVKRNIILLC